MIGNLNYLNIYIFQIKLGRSVVNDVQLHESQLISREHAILEKNDEKKWLLTDLSSSNGLYVNGSRLKANQSFCLSEGDLIEIGRDTDSKVAVYQFNFMRETSAKRSHESEFDDNEVAFKRSKLNVTNGE